MRSLKLLAAVSTIGGCAQIPNENFASPVPIDYLTIQVAGQVQVALVNRQCFLKLRNQPGKEPWSINFALQNLSLLSGETLETVLGTIKAEGMDQVFIGFVSDSRQKIDALIIGTPGEDDSLLIEAPFIGGGIEMMQRLAADGCPQYGRQTIHYELTTPPDLIDFETIYTDG